MLSLHDVDSFYGRAHILQGMTFDAPSGEVMVLLGRNGAGKSTTMKSVIGLVRPARGRIVFDGAEIAGREPYRIARAGIGYVPEERRVFSELTVLENLEVGRRAPPTGLARTGGSWTGGSWTGVSWTPGRLFELFPNLGVVRHRPAGRISGGEQQMLAIARTLMGNPRLVLLDEPSEGLAPLIVEQMAAAILTLKAEGTTVLLAEQNLHFATRVADRAVVIEKGRVAWLGTLEALRLDEAVRAQYLAV